MPSETDLAHLAQTSPSAFQGIQTSCPVPFGCSDPFSLRSIFQTEWSWHFLALPCLRANRRASFGRVPPICCFSPHQPPESQPPSTAHCPQWYHCSVPPIIAPSPSPVQQESAMKMVLLLLLLHQLRQTRGYKTISSVTLGNSSYQEQGVQSITLIVFTWIQRKKWRKNVQRNMWTIKT